MNPDDRYYIQKLDRAWAILDSRGRGLDGAPYKIRDGHRVTWERVLV